MKKLNVSLLSTVAASILLQTSLSSAMTRYIWSSSQGLKKAANCQVTSQDQIPFYAVEKDGKFVDGILSSSQIGSISKNSLKEISDSIFEFKDKSLQNDIAGKKLSETYLQAAFDGDDYAALVCKSGMDRKGYVLFNVFSAGQEDAVAQIAINKNDAALLNNVRVHNVEDATKMMEEKATQALVNSGATAPGLSVVMNSRSSAVIPSSAAAPKLEHGAVVSPAAEAVEADAGPVLNESQVETITDITATAARAETVRTEVAKSYVICSPTADLRVRDQNLKKILFSVKRMTKIKPLQTLGSGKKFEVDGRKYSFIKIEISENKKTGFVAEQMVKTAAECGGQSVAVTAPAATTAPSATVAAPVKPVVTTGGNSNLLAPSCATEKIMSAAKTDVRIRWGNRAAGRGQCALGVRLSLQRSGVGGISGGIGNAIDFIARLKGLGFVETGIRDVTKAPAGSVLVFGGPYTSQYLRNGVMRKPYGNYVGHVTIKGDDGFYYTDGRTAEPAIGWSRDKNVAGRRNLMGVMMPGTSLVNQFAGKCN